MKIEKYLTSNYDDKISKFTLHYYLFAIIKKITLLRT